MKDPIVRYFYFISLLIFFTESKGQIPIQVNKSTDGPLITYADRLFSFNGLLYFNGNLNGKAHQLIQSDGTKDNTKMPRFIPCFNQYGDCGDPTKFIQVNDKLFFCQFDSLGSVKRLWITDVQGSTPKQIKNFNQSNWQGYNDAIIFKNKLFFILDTYDFGTEIWYTDGTESGTSLLKEIVPGPTHSSSTRFLTVMNDALFFYADDGVNGLELWKTDGTSAGTNILKDINTGPNSSSYGGYKDAVVLNNSFYFSADDGIHGIELWKSDGTSNGTTIVKDIIPGIASSVPYSFVTLNNSLFFVASDKITPSTPYAISNYELFKSDGTAINTYLLKDINGDDVRGSGLSNLLICNNKIIFTANNIPTQYSYNNELYSSDGTTEGTLLLKEINPGEAGSTPNEFEFFGTDTLFFSAFSEGIGRELWMTNGDVNGTHLVCDLVPGINGSSSPMEITTVNNDLYFTTENGTKLWKMDIRRAVNLNSDVGVYPNPFNEALDVYLKKPTFSNIKINLYNMLGEKIYKNEFSNSNNITLKNLDILPIGIYIIEIITNDDRFEQKLIKHY